MKISELKQPYRRMAEYLGNENNTISHSLNNNFFRFYNKMHKGEYPEITPEIKTNFPADFDFSGDVEDERRYNFAFKNNMEEKYTQLAKEGKFDQLPDTCEFSEAVELEVWDEEIDREILEISGKYKGFYIFFDNEDDADELGVVICTYKHAQLPTPKIDFSEFKTGDVVEVEVNEDTFICYYAGDNEGDVFFNRSKTGLRFFKYKKNIKSITKIK